MANLKEIRSRITSVSSTMQITSAMKMVSAAKLRRAQDAITQMRPYAEKLQEILGNLSSSLDASENPYTQQRDVKNILVVGITSNRGLCGGFNNAVIKRVRRLIAEDYKNANVTVLPVGKKIAESLKGTEYAVRGSVLPTHPEKVWDDLNFETSSEIAQNLMDRFEEGSFDKVVLVYNAFKNAAVQDLTIEQMLPIVPATNEVETSSADYIFEPSKKEIVTNLVPNSLKIQFYKALLDSNASEHGARMTAMHKATDNATSLKKELQLSYNKARQAAITNEILEIVGGAEALNG
ncbi:ATP synthase F1 subunit gamma [Parvicella tangerina]|uniref:ATP synthase gamma chain n=1 Tax=Parvicella tangerina TaxID=2829795 RepID=A0A916JQZ1_9FLAO|nr:ATP synthase F1 subunit gamma [Parvicella tangerina]CAG5085542.1 ATP synthase gamma chain [Parvicella tangerina]